jgi:hypothetical protein
MENSNYLIFGGVIAAVIVVFIIVLLIIKTPKPKPKPTPTHNTTHNTTPKTKQEDNFLPSSNCLKNHMTFTDITNAKPCVNTSGVGKPAFVLFIRHCDRAYNNTISIKNHSAPCQGWDTNLKKMVNVNCGPIPENPNSIYRTTCEHKTTWSDCLGCEYLEGIGGCASNDCSEEGLNRAWALGKWVDCFAKRKNISVAAIVGQSFVPQSSNARPMTTASIILDSLMNLGHNPCYLEGNKGQTEKIGPLVNTSAFDGKIVVIVWDHGELTKLINQVTGVSKDYHDSGKKDSTGNAIYVPNVPAIIWDDCCFDQVTVIDKTSPLRTSATAYNAMSLKNNDICGSKCAGKSPYPLCSYDNFADKTPKTICSS